METFSSERRLSYERRLPYQVFSSTLRLLLETVWIFITSKYAATCKRHYILQSRVHHTDMEKASTGFIHIDYVRT